MGENILTRWRYYCFCSIPCSDGKDVAPIDGFIPAQRFFLSTSMATNIRVEERVLIKDDVHCRDARVNVG